MAASNSRGERRSQSHTPRPAALLCRTGGTSGILGAAAARLVRSLGALDGFHENILCRISVPLPLQDMDFAMQWAPPTPGRRSCDLGHDIRNNMIGGLEAWAALDLHFAGMMHGDGNSSVDAIVLRMVRDTQISVDEVAETRRRLLAELALMMLSPRQNDGIDQKTLWSVPPEADFLVPESEPSHPEYTVQQYAGFGEIDATSDVTAACKFSRRFKAGAPKAR